MSRVITGRFLHPDGTPRTGEMVIVNVLQGYVSEDSEVIPKHKTELTIDSSGDVSITLKTPTAPATVHLRIEEPDHYDYETYLASGVATTFASLRTLAGSAVAQDAVQTLIDANNVLSITNVDDTYVVLDTDEWVRCDGTFTVTLPAATGSGFGCLVMNIGTGVITVDADGTDTINGLGTQLIPTLDSIFVLDAASGAWDAR